MYVSSKRQSDEIIIYLFIKKAFFASVKRRGSEDMFGRRRRGRTRIGLRVFRRIERELRNPYRRTHKERGKYAFLSHCDVARANSLASD